MILNRYSPRLVVFDVEPSFDIYEYAEDNNHVRYLKYLKPYYNQLGISDIFKDVSDEEWYKAHSGLIRYNTEIIPRVVDNIFNRGMDPCGFTSGKGSMTEEPQTSPQGQRVIDPFKLNYINKLISLCKDKSVSLVFISSPKYGATDSDILQPAKDIAMQNEVPFLDFYSDSRFVFHKEWFSEPMHLNGDGAREYSKMIAGVLPDYMR